MVLDLNNKTFTLKKTFDISIKNAIWIKYWPFKTCLAWKSKDVPNEPNQKTEMCTLIMEIVFCL